LLSEIEKSIYFGFRNRPVSRSPAYLRANANVGHSSSSHEGKLVPLDFGPTWLVCRESGNSKDLKLMSPLPGESKNILIRPAYNGVPCLVPPLHDIHQAVELTASLYVVGGNLAARQQHTRRKGAESTKPIAPGQLPIADPYAPLVTFPVYAQHGGRSVSAAKSRGLSMEQLLAQSLARFRTGFDKLPLGQQLALVTEAASDSDDEDWLPASDAVDLGATAAVPTASTASTREPRRREEPFLLCKWCVIAAVRSGTIDEKVLEGWSSPEKLKKHRAADHPEVLQNKQT
jgi:hypothetical protein